MSKTAMYRPKTKADLIQHLRIAHQTGPVTRGDENASTIASLTSLHAEMHLRRDNWDKP